MHSAFLALFDARFVSSCRKLLNLPIWPAAWGNLTTAAFPVKPPVVVVGKPCNLTDGWAGARVQPLHVGVLHPHPATPAKSV